MKNTNHVPTYAVIEALQSWLGAERADEILGQLRYHASDDFWSFRLHGIFVGVERDGYIHS